MSRSWEARVSWFSVSSRLTAVKGSPGRSSRFRSMEWLTENDDVRGSGMLSTSRS
jgi:hypothetical protein